MPRNSLDPIKEESSISDTRLSQGNTSNVVVLDPVYCPCAKFFKGKPKDKDPCDGKSYSSILDRPFIFRREASLDMAVQLQEKNLRAMYSSLEEEEPPVLSDITFESSTSSVTRTTSTPCVPSLHDVNIDEHRLEYLLKLQEIGGGEEKSVASHELEFKGKETEELKTESEAMRLAQKYLRIHRIFELYQFLIAHLLGNLPENPISFLLDLLDKCIIYRASMGQPPLLYEKKHIEALFNLMDPMRTGYIDLDQYVTGMKTLGICSFNQHPLTTRDNMVMKETFVEEAYENLIELLNDLLKRRWINPKGGNIIAPLTTPPPTLAHLIPVSQSAKMIPNATSV